MIPAQLTTLLEQLDTRPTVTAYVQTARDLNAMDLRLPRVRIAMLSTWTTAPLIPFLTVETARRGFIVSLTQGSSPAVIQQLLSQEPDSGLVDADVVFVAILLADLCPPLWNDFLHLDPDTERRLRVEALNTVTSAVAALRSRSSAAIVVHNFALPMHPLLGIHEPMARRSQTEAIRSLNSQLVERLGAIAGVHVLDFDRIHAQVGHDDAVDDRLWALGRVAVSSRAMPALARVQAAFVQAICGTAKKCLVLDLDNTLWGGVVGELGIGGIQIGGLHPGNVYRGFQEALRQLAGRGILLAINSKNNLADVDEVFDTHPDMVLRRTDFAAQRINWNDKAANMRELAVELDLGLDSLVFFDDSPVERAWMRQALPEVLTIEPPVDPAGYARSMLASGVFDRVSYTDEDSRRSALYRARAEQRDERQAVASLDDFLAGLEMQLTVQALDRLTFPRALELLHKTNQFNLTTRRHSAATLTSLMEDPDSGVFSARLLDRFGDNGIIGVAIVRQAHQTAVIDTLLLSCRVINRQVETALLSCLVEWSRSRGARFIQGEFISTARNAAAGGFFEQHGFCRADAEVSDTWILNLSVPIPFEVPRFIRLDRREAVMS